jgi:hypothetical protein
MWSKPLRATGILNNIPQSEDGAMRKKIPTVTRPALGVSTQDFEATERAESERLFSFRAVGPENGDGGKNWVRKRAPHFLAQQTASKWV